MPTAVGLRLRVRTSMSVLSEQLGGYRGERSLKTGNMCNQSPHSLLQP